MLDDIIEENDLSKLHGDVILSSDTTQGREVKQMVSHREVCLLTFLPECPRPQRDGYKEEAPATE